MATGMKKYTKDTPGYEHWKAYFDFLAKYEDQPKIMPTHLKMKYENATPLQIGKINVPVRSNIVQEIRDIFSKVSGENLSEMTEKLTTLDIHQDHLDEIVNLIYQYTIQLPDLIKIYISLYRCLQSHVFEHLCNRFRHLLLDSPNEYRLLNAKIYCALLEGFPAIRANDTTIRNVLDIIHNQYAKNADVTRIDEYIEFCKILRHYPDLLPIYRQQWDIMALDKRIPTRIRFGIQDLIEA